jgi:hypothetical protein
MKFDLELTRIIRRRNKEMYVLPVNHLIWWMKSSDREGNQMAGSGEERGGKNG